MHSLSTSWMVSSADLYMRGHILGERLIFSLNILQSQSHGTEKARGTGIGTVVLAFECIYVPGGDAHSATRPPPHSSCFLPPVWLQYRGEAWACQCIPEDTSRSAVMEAAYICMMICIQ